jgi:hypothetical protein
LQLALPGDQVLRCYSLGFVVGADAPVRIEAMVTSGDGASTPPVELELPQSRAVAGIVEVEPVPTHGTQMHLAIESEAEQLTLYDLFVISNG